MMKTKVFSVYDTKLKVYSAPWLCDTLGAAERAFSDAANDKNVEMSKHPEDYTLFYIADFDKETGVFNSVQQQNLGLASQFVRES